MKNIKEKTNKKRLLLLLVAVLVVIAAGVSVYAFVIKPSKEGTSPSSDDRSVNDVDYNQPSREEVEADDKAQEEQNKRREELDAQPPATTAEIVITYAQQYGGIVETRAYVQNLHQSGGSCTATYRKGGQADVSVTREAVPDAKTIQCGALDIPRASFIEAGQWTLTITYDSATAKGSATKSITIE